MSQNIVVCGMSAAIVETRDVVLIQYERRQTNEEKRRALYQALGRHCCAERGIVGGDSAIVTDFSSKEDAIQHLQSVIS